ncbi:MAG TPA: glycosyltransferase, partial [Lamprocystis sp. (in: g-proteobacteria)]|nr:glycosyltransferase [Lamprocystis sp. (in: g-proteobacteria)]
MRVAHVITGLEIGGAEMMLHKLLTAMDPTAFEPLVISLISPGPMGARIADLGIPVETLAMGRGLPAPGAVLRLAGRLRAFRPDVIQTWMYHADLLGALAVPLIGMGSGRPAL